MRSAPVSRFLRVGIFVALYVSLFASRAPDLDDAHGAARPSSVWRSDGLFADLGAATIVEPAPPVHEPFASTLQFMGAYESASNLRAFVQDAVRQPGRGGAFYALMALSECRAWQGAEVELAAEVVAHRSHAELVHRLDWVGLSDRRCASFVAADLDDSQVDDLYGRGRAQGDPLVLAYLGWLDALEQGSVEALLAAMEGVLQNADPGLLRWVAATGHGFLVGGHGNAGSIDETSMRRRLDAWALLPCEFGADCSRPDLGAGSPCIGAGLCAEGRRGFILRSGPWANDADRAALLAEVAALKCAVLARDAHAVLGL